MEINVRLGESGKEQNYKIKIGFGTYSKIQTMAFRNMPKEMLNGIRDQIYKKRKDGKEVADIEQDPDMEEILANVDLGELIGAQTDSKLEIIKLAVVEPEPDEEFMNNGLDPLHGEELYERIMAEVKIVADKIQEIRDKKSGKDAPSSKQ